MVAPTTIETLWCVLFLGVDFGLKGLDDPGAPTLGVARVVANKEIGVAANEVVGAVIADGEVGAIVDLVFSYNENNFN